MVEHTPRPNNKEMRPVESSIGPEVTRPPIPAAQVVLIRAGESGPEVFMGRRSAGGYQNQWSFPGGKLDDGETYPQAAVRELGEETGVSITEENLKFLREAKSSTVRNKEGVAVRHDFNIEVYVADGTKLDPQNINTKEHSEMKWILLSEAFAMHERALEANDASDDPQTLDKIPDAISPSTLETLQFIAEQSGKVEEK